jgi:hypothetical protein
LNFPDVKVLWDFKLCRWVNGSRGPSIMGFQAVSLAEFSRGHSLWYFKLFRWVNGSRGSVSWDFKLYLWLNGFRGPSFMGFQAVPLCDWFQRFSLIRFQAVSLVELFPRSEGWKCLHIQGSNGPKKNILLATTPKKTKSHIPNNCHLSNTAVTSNFSQESKHLNWFTPTFTPAKEYRTIALLPSEPVRWQPCDIGWQHLIRSGKAAS